MVEQKSEVGKMDHIAAFVKASGLEIEAYEAYYYGNKELADGILDCLLRGDKRATTSLKALYEIENEPIPKVGDYSVILNSKEEPKCITRITKIELVPFDEITEAYAFIEGEGDKTLAYWKKAHRTMFEKDCEEVLNRPFSGDLICVCEYFEVVYQEI